MPVATVYNLPTQLGNKLVRFVAPFSAICSDFVIDVCLLDSVSSTTRQGVSSGGIYSIEYLT